MVTTYTRRFGARGSGSLVESLESLTFVSKKLSCLIDRSSSGMHHDGHTPCYRACRRCENIRLGFIFRGFNFRGSLVNLENRKNWLPRKFPAIR